MVRIPTARDCMSDYLVTLKPDTSINEALDTLVSKRASGAPVVDEHHKFVGVLTEKDCLRILSQRAMGEYSEGRVGDFMSTVKAVVEADMDIFAVASIFLDTNVPVLPVMRGEELIGRISRQDMLRATQNVLNDVTERKRRENEDFRVKSDPRGIADRQKAIAESRPESIGELMRNRRYEE